MWLSNVRRDGAGFVGMFFEAPAALERALGAQVPPATVELGRLAPKKTLAQLLAAATVPDLASLLRKMDEGALELLAQGAQAAALADKVRSLHRLAPAAAG